LCCLRLVSLSGIADMSVVEMVSQQSLRRLFDVNVFGLVETSQAFLPMLRKSKGRIVNIGSNAGDITMPGEPCHP
jgi:NAD(P)-dependent dehydrogenase (short-subunit alcohol dehydrogenase family)